MTFSKYDPHSYIRHPALIIHGDKVQKIHKLFGSALLLIKWKMLGTVSTAIRTKTLTGLFTVNVSTPLGNLEPQQYRLKVTPHADQFIQFIAVNSANIDYSLEVTNPPGLLKTSLEIWQFLGDNADLINSSSSSGNTNIMSINYPPTPSPTSTTGTSVAVTYAIISTTISAANALRVDGGLIINNANRNLWIVFSATPATTAAPSVMVPANGGSIDIPSGYVGAVTGIWNNGGFGTATVVEFI